MIRSRAGWVPYSLTERVVEFRKDCPMWRKYTGQDGVVRVRAEPGIDRGLLIERAMVAAEQADADLSQRIAKDLMPSGKQWADYRAKCRTMTRIMETGEESYVIGRKRV